MDNFYLAQPSKYIKVHFYIRFLRFTCVSYTVKLKMADFHAKMANFQQKQSFFSIWVCFLHIFSCDMKLITLYHQKYLQASNIYQNNIFYVYNVSANIKNGGFLYPKWPFLSIFVYFPLTFQRYIKYMVLYHAILKHIKIRYFSVHFECEKTKIGRFLSKISHFLHQKQQFFEHFPPFSSHILV